MLKRKVRHELLLLKKSPKPRAREGLDDSVDTVDLRDCRIFRGCVGGQDVEMLIVTELLLPKKSPKPRAR